MTVWENATGEAAEASNLNDIEARIEAAVPAFNQRTWTQKTSATPLSAANLNALEEAAASASGLVFNVTADPYNATGDGVTDDTTAVQECINDAKQTGGTAFFPIGVYRVTSTIWCSTEVGPGPNQLRGYQIRGAAQGRSNSNGRGATILYDPPSPVGAGPCLSLMNAFELELCYVGVEYPDNGFDGDLIYVDGNTAVGDPINWQIHHISSRAQGVKTARSVVRLHKTIIGEVGPRNQFGGADYSVYFEPSSYNVGIHVHDNTYNFAGEAHIHLGSPDGENITIENEVFEAGVSTTAIYGGSTPLSSLLYAPVIRGCWFGDASGDTTWIKNIQAWQGGVIEDCQFNPFLGGTAMDGLAGHWTIRNNHIVGSGGGADTIFGDASNANLHLYDNRGANVSAPWTVAPETLEVCIGNTGLGLDENSLKHGHLGLGLTDHGVNASGDGKLLLGKAANGASVPLSLAAAKCGVYTSHSGNQLYVQNNGTGEVKILSGTSENLRVSNGGIGFHGSTPTSKPTITGSRGGNAALASLLTALANKGLITDNTTA